MDNFNKAKAITIKAHFTRTTDKEAPTKLIIFVDMSCGGESERCESDRYSEQSLAMIASDCVQKHL